MYAPHTATVFNTWEDEDFNQHIVATVLRGVFIDISKAANVSKSGLTDADACKMFIPFDVRAESIDGGYKSFVNPFEFYTAEDKETLWTLDNAGQSNSTATYFVKGEVHELLTLAELKQRFEAFDVTTVDIRDFGSDAMRHWQVGGK